MTAERQFGFLWGGAALALILISPFGEFMTGALPACPMKTFVGLPCPGCGTTRAALALAHLDLVAAFELSPLAALAWTLFVAGGLLAGTFAALGRPVPQPPTRLPGWARVAVVTLVLVNWVYLITHGT